MFHTAFKKQKISGKKPLDFYRRVRTENSCLLCTELGRYTLIGYQPFMTFESRNGRNCIRRISYDEDSIEVNVQVGDADPLSVLEAVFDSVKISKLSNPPKDFPSFACGAIGYFSYNFGLDLYGIESRVKDDLKTKDLSFSFYDKIIVFDHQKGDLYFIAFAENKKLAEKLVYEIEGDILAGLSYPREFFAGCASPKPKSNLTFPRYKKKISEIKNYLARGETYQVNFSQRFKCSYDSDPLDLFEKLYETNPSPYSCFIDDDDFFVVSCSPERLFSVNGDLIDARPIKGTVPRGFSPAEDKKMINRLMNSAKDNAELSMIVDLYRNDVGKVCRPGTVEVLKHRRIEKYSHVIHTVSVVRGRLLKTAGISDIVKAMFPGGSVTGCPKKRTMEIIDKLEDYARGVYCGSAGYISFGGNMDFNILIRTFAYTAGNLYFHGGGGIVVDSDAEAEYKETLDKVEALRGSI